MSVRNSVGGLAQLDRWAWTVADAINNNRAYQPFWADMDASGTIEKPWTFIVVDTTGGAVAPVLPTGMPQGWAVIIQDSGNAGTNNITVTRGGSDTINGGNTLVISSNYGRLTLYSDGAGKWYAA